MSTSHPKYKLLKSRWMHLGLLLLAGLLIGRWIGVVVFTLTTMLGYEVALQSRLFMMQSAVSTSTLIVAPLVYWCWVEEQPLHCLFLFPNRHLIPSLITLGLVLAFMVVNTWFVEWNRIVQLPSWLSGFEAWARNQEEEQQQLLALLTTFPTLRVLLTGLFVMGIIPAVGEELLFRGIIQSLLYCHWRNVHMAIGVSAFVFSAVHCQLYGLVPRWLLGILFGYVYWWTKDLRFPILAHFCNNALTLLLLFLHQHRWIDYNVAAATVPSRFILAFCIVLVIVLAWCLRQLRAKVFLHAPPKLD